MEKKRKEKNTVALAGPLVVALHRFWDLLQAVHFVFFKHPVPVLLSSTASHSSGVPLS